MYLWANFSSVAFFNIGHPYQSCLFALNLVQHWGQELVKAACTLLWPLSRLEQRQSCLSAGRGRVACELLVLCLKMGKSFLSAG